MSLLLLCSWHLWIDVLVIHTLLTLHLFPSNKKPFHLLSHFFRSRYPNLFD